MCKMLYWVFTPMTFSNPMDHPTSSEVMISIRHIRNLRFREIKWITWGHKARTKQNKNSTQLSLTKALVPLITVLYLSHYQLFSRKKKLVNSRKNFKISSGVLWALLSLFLHKGPKLRTSALKISRHLVQYNTFKSKKKR